MAETSTSADDRNETPAAKTAGRGGPGRWIKLGIALLVVIGLVVWIGKWFYHQHTHISGDDARVMTHQITVSSRLDGRVTDFSLIVGDKLAQDDVVARLYDRPDQLLLDKLEAKVRQVQAQVDLEEQQIDLSAHQLSGGIKETEGQLDTDLAAADAAKAAMEKSKRTYERSNRLYKTGTVSVQKKDEDYYTYEAAKAEYQRAQRQVAVDRSSLSNARNGMMSGTAMTLQNPELLKAQLNVTRQSLAEAKAELGHQQLQVDDLVVDSPIDGIVDKTFVEQGEYVSAGQPLLMMHAPDNVWVEANIKETKVRDLHPGQPVEIAVDAYPDLHFEGHVQVIGQAATSQFALLPNPNPSGNFTKITQRIPVRIAIDKGPLKQLSPGMMVVVDIDISGNGSAAQTASR